ncbi:MAG: MFS transporter, partial [Chloroflexi bacterium]|nr:MFS transporter [Chloroflexota bacterium]
MRNARPLAEGGVRQWRSLSLLTLAELLALAPWFSAAAVAPLIQAEWQLSAGTAAWLTLAVQLGFVAGTLVSGVLNIPDRFDASRLFALSAAGAALTTAGLAVIATGPLDGAVLRFLTGAFLAGVYPPGLKLAATWTRRSRGLALSLIVGALTVGSASPHLVRALLDASWRPVVLVTAGLALAAGLLVLGGVRQGPFAAPSARFNPRFALQIARAPGLRLATLGYLGHQWELYACQ